MSQAIQGPRGTQDILPAQSYKWLYAEAFLRQVVENYGYREIRLPTFEHTELFLRGVGETTDIVGKEMYTFDDKAQRSLTLRPEGTSSTVRAVMQHGLMGGTLPLKAYYLQSCFRYEKPQKGRLREFHQIGIEAFGATGPEVDVEVIATGAAILAAAGINNTRLEVNSLGCPNCRPKYLQALRDYFAQYESSLCETCQSRLEKNPLRILDCKSPQDQEVAKNAPLMQDYLCEECEEHFQGVKKGLDNIGIPYLVNPTIVRGLDYYTKTVFEFIHTGAGAQGTVCGGGRYDGLFEELGGPPTPGIGFGLGIERLLMVMEAEGSTIPQPAGPALYVGNIGPAGAQAAQRLVQQMRMAGFFAECDVMNRSLKAQMRYADKIGAAYSLVLGDEEVEAEKAKLKNMQTGEEKEIALADILAFFQK
ncbi:histidine--tRNA ligase [Ruminococcaceae bacterium OttesenSCG-928-N02]|nr:histidine--tRNA ligase [Ruminococcaceae bacterium OttesenSCG-928-N02]